MKAEIINGQLVLMPGNETEQYSLVNWLAVAGVAIDDARRNESVYIRGSCVKICEPARSPEMVMITMSVVPPA